MRINCVPERISVTTLVLLMAMLATPSSKAGIVDWLFGDSIEKILQTSIDYLDSSQGDWQTIIVETRDKLIKEGHSAIANDVNRVLENAVSDAGLEARCTIDFVRQRLVSDLQKILSRLTGEPVSLNPAFCNPNPTSINALEVAKGNQLSLDISGYNLNLERMLDSRLISAHLVDRFDRRHSIKNYLANPSSYLLSVNLGSNGVPINSDSNFIEFIINGTKRTVNINQPQARKVPAKLVDIPMWCPPRWDRGDKDFKGHGPDITVEVELFLENESSLMARVYMKAVESKSDWTGAEGWADFSVWTAPPNTRIVSWPRQKSILEYRDDGHSAKTSPPQNGGPVHLFTTKGDTDGDDVGNCTWDDVYVQVGFKSVNVELKDVF